MFVLPQMTVPVLRVLVIALLFTVRTGLVFPCSENPALFGLMPTAPRARGAVKQLSAEPRTFNRGSAWSLSSPPASRHSESAAGEEQGACQSQRRRMIVGQMWFTQQSASGPVPWYLMRHHMGLGLRWTHQYTVLTRFSVRNSNFMLPALSRATHHAFQRHHGAAFHRCYDCEVVYLKLGARRRDNLGARRRDCHGLGSRAMGAAQHS